MAKKLAVYFLPFSEQPLEFWHEICHIYYSYICGSNFKGIWLLLFQSYRVIIELGLHI